MTDTTAQPAPVPLPAKMPPYECAGGEYPSRESYNNGYAEGWNDCVDAIAAAPGATK